MRIVGGAWRGKRLEGPGDTPIRPTTDRVREALFNILSHADWAPPLEGARVLDLFAGTGALGLEALSRGAKRACFVENNFQSRAIIRRNIETCGAIGTTKMLSRSVTRLEDIPVMTGGPFNLVFVDPPYRQGLIEPALTSIHEGGWLAENALVITERDPREDAPRTPEFTSHDERRYGDILIAFLSYEG